MYVLNGSSLTLTKELSPTETATAVVVLEMYATPICLENIKLHFGKYNIKGNYISVISLSLVFFTN
jgi:hypothetical protein